ncbi:YqjK family protein [Sideroxydans sp. CL21]|uniref:YqjK family protein n=1 Tax=Sideroxydans sp. CL21 TaxID=2600596 RepID=UPI0024BD2E22|nr:YqjK family protein [Sideroxydans sp. CL21]
MNKHLARIAQRRLELLEQIEVQRMAMAETSLHLHRPLAVVDVGLHAVRMIQAHPVLFAGGMTALLTWRRHGIVGLAKNGWRLLYLYPSAIFFGLKYLASALGSKSEDSDNELL